MAAQATGRLERLTVEAISTGRPVMRRTQAQRRATTQRALVQATVRSLIECGYAATTTSEVQQRAGVSRGALSHHFASKADLLLAATDHLYAEFSIEIRAAAAVLPTGPERIRPAIRMLWDHFNGPLFQAAMELWVAARTDPELRLALLPHERRLGAELRDLATEVFGETTAEHPSAPALYHLLTTSMRGQAMTYMLQPEAPPDGQHLQHWFDLVEAFEALETQPAP